MFEFEQKFTIETMLKSIINTKVTVNYTPNFKLLKLVVKNRHNFSTNAGGEKFFFNIHRTVNPTLLTRPRSIN